MACCFCKHLKVECFEICYCKFLNMIVDYYGIICPNFDVVGA